MKGLILPFTPQNPVFIGFSGEQVKGEGLNRISILNFLRYKDFSKRNLPHLFSNKTSKYTFTQKLLHTFPIKPLQTLPIKRK